jgi:ubiquinone/menaquinone biosynthesis C-methylase UbiE
MRKERTQEEFYKEYYMRAGADRNDLRLNPGVLFQALAAEKAFVRAARDIRHDPAAAKVLDVGCGGGGDLFQVLRAGYDQKNITGIDIQQDRLDAAKRLYPSICFVAGDAAKLNFPDGMFDLVFESTMFATLTDADSSAKIAAEMLRVCGQGGYLLLLDWRTPKPGAADYKALTKDRLAKLFKTGTATEIVGVYPGALVPPVGRFFSAYLCGLYFLVAAVFPFLVGQVVYLLRKK